MANSSLQINVVGTDMLQTGGKNDKEVISMAADYLHAIRTGSKRAASVKFKAGGANPLKAYGTVTFASSSGTVGVLIAGVSITVTWATSDAASGTLLAAAINASTNALVQYQVQASNFAGTITLSTCTAGSVITLGDHKFVAVAGAAGDNTNEFTIAGTDTADATALVTAMLGVQYIRENYVVTSSSGVVTVRQRSGTSVLNVLGKYNDSGVSLSAIAASAVTLISAIEPGVTGNQVTIAATGTNVTAAGVTGADSVIRLTGGAGNNVSPVTIEV